MPRPLRVAVIGSGPSGFFAAEELLSQSVLPVELDLFDALPTPFGLVRGGVAPDHPKIKSVTKIYEKTAARPAFRFYGNVEFGRDLFIEDLKRFYDAVVFAHGARSDHKMDIPGENLAGSHAATEFVGWYNGHPDYRDQVFDLSVERAAVIGNGNVAMDVTRILAQDPDELAPTDIASHAVEALRKSRIKEIYLLGRRGALQAAFTNPEIRELCELKGADLVVSPSEIELDLESHKDLEKPGLSPTVKTNVEILRKQSLKGEGVQPRKVRIRFLVSPVELIGEKGKVKAVKLEKNVLVRQPDGTLRPRGTGHFETLGVGLVLRSVGYLGVELPGIPFEPRKGIVPNDKGRILDPATKKTMPGLYVVGWAKRGPSGVIGTNKPDSIETAQLLLEDFKNRALDDSPDRKPAAVAAFLQSKKIQPVSFADWKVLDQLEIERGRPGNKTREKFTRVPEMLDAIRGAKNLK